MDICFLPISSLRIQVPLESLRKRLEKKQALGKRNGLELAFEFYKQGIRTAIELWIGTPTDHNSIELTRALKQITLYKYK